MSAKGDKTKEQICMGAYRLFVQKGFKNVTMKNICEITGLSRGGLYRHYSSTEEIFMQIVDFLMQNQENKILEKIQQGIAAERILWEILEQYEKEMVDNENSLSLAIYEFFSMKQQETEDNLLYVQYSAGCRTWEALIQYGIKTGEFRDTDAKAVIDLILFSYQGVRMYSSLMPVDSEIPRRMMGLIRNMLLK